MSSGHAAAPRGGDPPPSHRRRRRGPAPRPPFIPPAPASSSSSSSCPPPAAADVFVTARTDFRAQLRRCQRLLAPGGGSAAPAPPSELRLHGLGLAVPRAINLALQLQAAAPGALRLHASTSSVTLPPSTAGPPRRRRGAPPGRQDEEEEEDDDEEEEDGEGAAPRPRHNSAIHIRVCREAPCA
uniref:POP7 homolog, ribonuclease P/MRP subunit n=2 Tax=Strigops habroptila TaxID=2489341 RepID=A0A672UI99_STRHB